MSHDTLIHRAVRPLVRRIAPSGVTPNQLTTARLLTGAGAGGCCALGGATWPAVGGVLLLLSLLLDRADGELARQTGRTSAGGYRYDLACDCLATMLVFLGMGIGAQAALDGLGVWLGAAAGVSVAVVFFEINILRLGPPRRGSARSVSGMVDPDDAMMAAPVLIWLGLMPWTVVAAALLTPIAALALAVLGGLDTFRSRREGRARAASPP